MKTDPAAWTYASGRAAALETQLLKRDFFVQLSDMPPEEGAERIGRTHLSGAVPEPWGFAVFDEKLDALVEESRRDLELGCPDSGVIELAAIEARARRTHERIRSAAGSGREDAGPSLSPDAGPEEVVEFLKRMAPVAGEFAEEILEEMAAAAAEVGEGAFPEGMGPRAASLVLDSCFLAVALDRARATGSQAIEDYFALYAQVKCGGSALRTASNVREFSLVFRCLMRRGVMRRVPWSDRAKRAARMVFGGRSVTDARNADERQCVEAAFLLLPPDLAQELRKLDNPAARFDALASARLDALLEDARRIPFGPERVFAYLKDTEKEAGNARLALAASSVRGAEGAGMERSEVLVRLRK